MQFILLAVNGHHTNTLAGIDDSHLTVVAEIWCLQRVDGFELQHFAYWHCSSENETVVH